MSVSQLATLFGLVMGVSSFIGGAILWYKGAIEKRYAAERDFAHLRRNYEQIAGSISVLTEEVESLCETSTRSEQMIRDLAREVETLNRTYIESKGLLTANYHRIEAIAATVSSGTTSGWKNS